MTDHTRDKVLRTRHYLLSSALPEDAKDGLQSLLDSAATAANGTTDRIGAMADAILALALHEVRQAVRAPSMVGTAIDAHLAACPLAGKGKRGALIAVALRPWPWIAIAALSFSPHAPAIIRAIEAAIK
jgi:hypothetical protein